MPYLDFFIKIKKELALAIFVGTLERVFLFVLKAWKKRSLTFFDYLPITSMAPGLFIRGATISITLK